MNRKYFVRLLATWLIRAVLVIPAVCLSDVPTFSLTKVADVPSYYGTFQSHNQKLVENSYGLFMTYAYGTDADPGTGKESWRLARSVDRGATWTTIWRGMTLSRPPVLETDAHGSIFIIESDTDSFIHLHQPSADGSAVFYRFDPELSFTSPVIKAINGGAAGKFSSAWDETRQRLYFMVMDSYHGPDTWLLPNNNFFVLDRDGNVLSSYPLTCSYVQPDVTSSTTTPGCITSSPSDANVQYPHLEIDANRLYAAWTTAPMSANSPQRYRAVFYIYADLDDIDPATQRFMWKAPSTAGPVVLTPPIVGNEHGPAQMVSLPGELTYTAPLTSLWLWNTVSKGGYLHFAYSNELSPNQQHYIRFSPTNNLPDITDTGIQGNTISIIADSGFFATDSLSTTPLFLVSSTASGGRLAILSSPSSDPGSTWTDFAESDVTPPPGYNWYAVSGNRTLTATGDIIGNVTTTTFSSGTPSTVYFFRVHAVDRQVPPPASSPGVMLGNGSLSVTSTASPDPAVAGANITYSITVTNNGPGTATGVVLTDNLGGADFKPTGSSANCSGTGSVSCVLGDLASGASIAVTVVAVANTAGILINSARTQDTGASVASNVQGRLTVSKSGSGNGRVASSGNKVWGKMPDPNNPGSFLYDYYPVAIDCGSTCSNTYNPNSVVTLTAAADATSVFSGWNGCPVVSGNTCPVTMTTSMSVTANFTSLLDLIPTALTVTRSGATLTIKDSVKNQGTAAAGPFTISYYLSTNTVYEPTDTQICLRSVSSLAAGTSSPNTGTLPTTCATPAVPNGAYYVLAVVDSGNRVVESNETNNTRTTTSTLSLGADLIPQTITVTKSGSTLTINDSVKNQGTVPAGGFTINFYLSKDTSYQSGTDYLICSRTVGSLGVSASNPASGTFTSTCTVPPTAPSGKYYVLVVDDATNVIGETVETNNTKATSGTITK